MELSAFCCATAYQIKPLLESLRSKFRTAIYREVAYVEVAVEGTNCDLFFFPYGSMVCWGCSKEQALKLLSLGKEFAVNQTDEVEMDEFTYIRGDTPRIVDDEIVIPNFDILTKLAISHGIAQSVKLGKFEVALQKTFALTRRIPEELASKGKITLSRKEIRKKMGELFIERNSINLHLDVLDTPEFFWDHPELEVYYNLTANYLDLTNRLEVLNQRLDIVHELFEMLGNELNHQHSSRLEWTIIWLIIIEVTLTLFRDFYHYS